MQAYKTAAELVEIAKSRGPSGSLLDYTEGETAKQAKAQKEELASQDWKSLLTLPKVKRSVQDANTIRYNIEFNHRCPRVVNTKDVMGCTFNIPIQYIQQAEGYERIRDEDRAQVNNLKDSMAWQPYSFQNSSLVYVVDRATRQQLTSPSEFNVELVKEGKYLFVCFGHQHSLTARRELHDEQPTKDSWLQIECKLYINLQSDMVRFLADEQNMVDQNTKGKTHQEIMKSMRVGMQVILLRNDCICA